MCIQFGIIDDTGQWNYQCVLSVVYLMKQDNIIICVYWELHIHNSYCRNVHAVCSTIEGSRRMCVSGVVYLAVGSVPIGSNCRGQWNNLCVSDVTDSAIQGCLLLFMPQQRLRLYQDKNRFGTVFTNCNFTGLPHWDTIPLAL